LAQALLALPSAGATAPSRTFASRLRMPCRQAMKAAAPKARPKKRAAPSTASQAASTRGHRASRAPPPTSFGAPPTALQEREAAPTSRNSGNSNTSDLFKLLRQAEATTARAEARASAAEGKVAEADASAAEARAWVSIADGKVSAAEKRTQQAEAACKKLMERADEAENRASHIDGKFKVAWEIHGQFPKLIRPIVDSVFDRPQFKTVTRHGCNPVGIKKERHEGPAAILDVAAPTEVLISDLSGDRGAGDADSRLTHRS